jgi:hypothetical protein
MFCFLPLDHQAEEMYFQSPGQLLEIIAQLEERNLFLIQHCQSTQEAIEELRQKFDKTSAALYVFILHRML